ncbi:MAG TPA: hypothetical protein VIQ22_07750 [Gammaproteobacteria bacterium]
MSRITGVAQQENRQSTMVNIEELSAKELYELAKRKEQEEARLVQMQEQLGKLTAQRETLIKKHQEDLAYADRKIEELRQQRQVLLDDHRKALTSIDRELQQLREDCDSKKAAVRKSAAASPPPPAAETPPKPAAPVARPATKAPPAKEELPPPLEEKEVGIEDIDESDLDLDLGIDLGPEDDSSLAQEGKRKPSSEAQLDELMGHILKIMKGRSYISETLLKEKLAQVNCRPENLGKLLETLVRQTKLVRRSGGNYVLGRAAKKK